MTLERAIETVPAQAPGELAFHAFVSPRARIAGTASLVVAVHGIALNALEQIECFAPLAADRGAVLLAPCFDTAEDGDYQRLGRRGRGRRADLALDQAIERLSQQTKIRFRARHFFGFSGGGQFVHRYAMAHPDRVDGAVVAAAGWYTFPDSRLAFPMGLRVGGALAGVRLEPGAFLRVPVRVVVGSLDVERDDSVRTSAKLDERQGRDRIERAQRWVAAMQAAARQRGLPPRQEMTLLEGAGHSFSDCIEHGLADVTFGFFDSIDDLAQSGASSRSVPERKIS